MGLAVRTFHPFLTFPRTAADLDAMGYAYAGEAGMIAGFSWATLCNWQMSMAWYRRPWYHAGGMIAGYMAFKVAAAYEDAQLKGKENPH